MISFIRGKLIEKAPTHAVIETHGVGFKLWIPLSSYKALGEVGQEVRVLSYLHAREDALQLFGFATEAERSLFLLLISVSGVGPKLAQGILSGISVEAFERAVHHQDVEALTAAPGVGKKTAERLALELRDKISEPGSKDGEAQPAGTQPVIEQAVLALMSLGYKRPRAKEMVQKILKGNPAVSVEEVIRQALQQM